MPVLQYVQFQGKSWISRIIQRWTRDPDSHSAVLDPARPDKPMIKQWPHSGNIKSWMDYSNFSNHTPGTPYQIWELAVSRKVYDEVMRFYRQSARAKREYDWSGIMAFLLKSRYSKNKTFCSEEMVTPLAQRLGWDRINPAVVHPGYFRNLLQAAGAVMVRQGVT